LYPFVGNTIGGSHVSVVALALGLPGSRYRPITAVHRAGGLTEYLQANGLPVVDAPDVMLVGGARIPAQVLAMARAVPLLVTFLRENRIDIVHTNDLRMHLTWVMATAIARIPMVWHQRSADDSRRLAYFSRFAPKVLTISEHCRRALASGMASRAQVVYDPFDTDTEPPLRAAAGRALKLELGIEKDVKIVGFVGNFTAQKRPLDFIRIAAALKDDYKGQAFFVMCGDPRLEMRPQVEALIAELSLSNHVRILGPRFPIERTIAGFDVMVAPAVNEGLGRTLVEGMLVGTPVIATDDGGHREVIINGRNGFLVPVGDTKAFVTSIRSILENPGLAIKIVTNADRDAHRRFPASRHCRTIIAIYDGLCQRGCRTNH
jgi:glycosyltransferase involved in cell wall biosynthesis